MKALIIAEHDGQHLKSSTRNVLTAATELSSHITLLVAGSHCQNVAEEVSHFNGVEKVLMADAPFYERISAEDLTELVLKIAHDFQYVLTPATTFGKNFLPRVAARLDVPQVSDVVKIISPNTFVRPIYAGNAYQTVELNESVYVLTIRTTAFKAATKGEQSAEIEVIEPAEHIKTVEFLRQEKSTSERPDLTQARIVVAGGRGLQSKENFQLIEKLAEKLGAAIGASRAAVDAGFISNDYQIGQTGKIVAPELYIAVGISGAIQHLAGMKDSKIIVAINKDGNAPIFQVADYGLVGDLFEVIPELCKEL
jgi:electron transfer flavoprotein alpha subunit